MQPPFYEDCFKFKGKDFRGAVCHDIDAVGDIQLFFWVKAKGKTSRFIEKRKLE